MNKIRDAIITSLLTLKQEMEVLEIDIKSITFDENSYDLICRLLEDNTAKTMLSCDKCPYITKKRKFLGIEIKKG